MKRSPLTRSAPFLDSRLLKARTTFAGNKAKQMMGAGNPLTGSATRKPASTYCSSCGKWHRPGNVCPATKAMPLVHKGDNVSHIDVLSGNPYRAMGKFAAQPGGPEGKIARDECDGVLSSLTEMSAAQPPVPAPELPPVSPTPPVDTLNPQHLISWRPQPEAQPTPEEMQQKLVGASGHLQGQEARYLDALRNWQARYGK